MHDATGRFQDNQPRVDGPGRRQHQRHRWRGARINLVLTMQYLVLTSG
jgi:hypothetical protein